MDDFGIGTAIWTLAIFAALVGAAVVGLIWLAVSLI